jgi:hypothetical protein
MGIMEREGLCVAWRCLVAVAATAACAAAFGFASEGAALAAAAPRKTAPPRTRRAAKRADKLKAPKRKGAAKISGALENGQTVTVATGTWKGTPPLSFSYQWEACDTSAANCSEISGANAASYQITSAQEGARLRALITATGPGGRTTATSKPTKLIGPGPPVDAASPSISGSLQEGQTLTAEPGTWAGTAPIGFTYQWLRCSVLSAGCEEIPGATGAKYTLGALDLASKLAVVVTASNVRGSASATSGETSPILALLPSNTLPPSISGTLRDGQLLSVTTGGWSGSEPISYGYQWQLCNPLGEGCEEMPGANGSSLKLAGGDIGGTLNVIVTATNAAGSTAVTSSPTGSIEGLLPVNEVLPAISGLFKEGGLLSVGTGSWSGSAPIGYSYQWQLCNALGEACSNISEATGSSLRLSSLDIGKTLAVVVKATNVAGSTSVSTPVTSLIEGLLPVNEVLPSITGTLLEGKSLTAASGSWSGTAPISYSYQWRLCPPAEACKNISEATASVLSLLAPYVGDSVEVVVKASNVAGSTTATSPVSSPISGIAPVNTALPVISGLLEVGKLLSVSNGTWSGTTPMSFKYQWQLCLLGTCTNISGATGATLSLLGIDVGDTLDAIVTATNVTGSSSATSKATEKLLGIL